MNENFSTRIKELRTSEGLTQKELAETLNISTVSVSSYETGAKTPSLDMVMNIAQKYNVSIDWLCGLSEKRMLDNRITTYKELFRLFITIFDTQYQDDLPTPASIVDAISIDEMSVSIILRKDPNFEKFFFKWHNIFKLYRDGTIDNDLYGMWIEKQLKEYDKPISIEWVPD